MESEVGRRIFSERVQSLKIPIPDMKLSIGGRVREDNRDIIETPAGLYILQINPKDYENVSLIKADLVDPKSNSKDPKAKAVELTTSLRARGLITKEGLYWVFSHPEDIKIPSQSDEYFQKEMVGTIYLFGGSYVRESYTNAQMVFATIKGGTSGKYTLGGGIRYMCPEESLLADIMESLLAKE